MKEMKRYRKYLAMCLLPGALALSACSSDGDDDDVMATATAPASVMEGASAELSGMGEGEGDLMYTWTQKSGLHAVIMNPHSATTNIIAPVLDLGNTGESLVFELTVTDEDGESASDEVSLSVDLNTEISKYKLTVTNITNGQPLTPVAALLHDADFMPWSIGQSATDGLEMLAESGSPSDFVSESMAHSSVDSFGVTPGSPIGPGGSKTLVVGATQDDNAMLSVASMLANTNDAFTGIKAYPVGSMEVDDTKTIMARVYDAGTEANTEASGSVAGPADTSTAADKGYSEVRDDPSAFVTLHPGVVTQDDGLTTSVLNESHRWLGDAAMIMVTRIQ